MVRFTSPAWATDVSEAQFPCRVGVGDIYLKLAYRFEPTHPLDGVTLTVPLALLNQLDAARFEWLVPGMIREKVASYLKGLPKQLRRHFVPVPDSVTEFLVEAELQKTASGLVDALTRYAHRKIGAPISSDDWDKAEIPLHLKMNYRVVDETGRELAMGRDLAKLKAELGQAAQLSGLFVILLWIPIRQAPGLGTLSNIVVIGFVMDLTIEALRLLGVPAKEVLSQDLPAAIALTVVGTALVGLGSGIYIGSGNGPGPRDGLMTGFHRITGRPIWIVRTVIEVIVGIVGYLLGGTFGFGTIWFALTIGPQVQFWLARVDPTGRAAKQSTASSRR